MCNCTYTRSFGSVATKVGWVVLVEVGKLVDKLMSCLCSLTITHHPRGANKPPSPPTPTPAPPPPLLSEPRPPSHGRDREAEAQFIVHDWGGKVDNGIWLSYRPVRLHRLAGMYDNPMPQSTLSPSKGLWIRLQDTSSGQLYTHARQPTPKQKTKIRANI